MALDLRKIRYFVAVYEEGSLSRAAAREKIVQPALSVQIRQLETELAVRLFDRSVQGVQPTPAGVELFQLCSGILRDLAALRQRMLDFGGAVAGTLRIGLMPSICRGPLPAILTAFLDAHPQVEVRVTEAYSGTLARLVLDGALDMAVCNRPAEQTGLKLRLLLRDPVVLVSCAQGAGPPPWAPCDLARVPELRLILPSGQHSLRRVLDARIKSGGIAPLRVMEMDGLGATLRMVQAGGWATLVPRLAVLAEAREGRLVINPVGQPGNLTSDIYTMHLPDRRPSLAGQRFTELAERELGRLSREPMGV